MSDANDGKMVFFYGLSQEEALLAMRAVKSALANPAQLAFAMATPNNMNWPVQELVEHVLEEHRQMNAL